jgi:hypothetical protein
MVLEYDVFPAGRSLLHMGIHRKSGRKSGNLAAKSGRPKNLERLAGQLFQIFCKKSKSWKNLASLNLESGTTFFAKGKKNEKIELRQSPIYYFQKGK